MYMYRDGSRVVLSRIQYSVIPIVSNPEIENFEQPHRDKLNRVSSESRCDQLCIRAPCALRAPDSFLHHLPPLLKVKLVRPTISLSLRLPTTEHRGKQSRVLPRTIFLGNEVRLTKMVEEWGDASDFEHELCVCRGSSMRSISILL